MNYLKKSEWEMNGFTIGTYLPRSDVFSKCKQGKHLAVLVSTVPVLPQNHVMITLSNDSDIVSREADAQVFTSIPLPAFFRYKTILRLADYAM